MALTRIGNQWGVGSGRNGLGQSMTAIDSPVGGAAAVGNLITAAQWNGVIQAINKCLAHQGRPTVTPASVVAGSPIMALTSLTNGSIDAYNYSGTTGLALTSGTVNSTSYSSNWGTAGSNALIFTQTLTFTNGDAARYFFNAGGTVSLTFAKTGGSTSASTAWNSQAAACGTVTLKYLNTVQTNNTYSPSIIKNMDNGGYWNLITTKKTHFKQFSGAGGYYNSNNINVNFFLTGTASNGGYPTLNIVTVWNNNSTVAITGTETVNVVVNYPATTYLTNTWGTPVFSGSATASTVVSDDTVL
jgi:hypothetical protein